MDVGLLVCWLVACALAYLLVVGCGWFVVGWLVVVDLLDDGWSVGFPGRKHLI